MCGSITTRRELYKPLICANIAPNASALGFEVRVEVVFPMRVSADFLAVKNGVNPRGIPARIACISFVMCRARGNRHVNGLVKQWHLFALDRRGLVLAKEVCLRRRFPRGAPVSAER